jgi:hypothetical protein
MRKIFLLFTLTVLTASAALFAYNPPFGSESYFLLPYPALLQKSQTAAPSGASNAGPYSVNLNPALTAGMQRFAADLGYTAITDGGDVFAGALHLGFVFPTRRGNFQAAVQTAFGFPDIMPLGDTITIRGGFSRDITEDFYVGASVFAGMPFSGGDFAAAVDLGILYRIGNLAFLKDARFGAALSNLGKTFNTDYDNYEDPAIGKSGINNNTESAHYPGLITPKLGFSACFFEYRQFQAYIAAGIAFPSFQDAVFNFGLDIAPTPNLLISVGYCFDILESVNTKWAETKLPSVSLSYKLVLDTGKAEILANQGWTQSDLNIAAAWQALGRNLHAFSLGAAANFGTRDNEAPEIEIWGDN